MHTRPVALKLATALLAVIGGVAVLAGAVLIVLASGRLPLLDSTRSVGAVLLLGVGVIVFAWFSWLAAGSLWRGRARGWVASLLVSVVAIGCALTAVANAGGQALVIVALAVTVLALAFVLARLTRRVAGVA